MADFNSVPFSIFLFPASKSGKKIFSSVIQFVLGALASVIFVLPTFFKYGLINGAGGTDSNVRFNPDNLMEFLTVLARFLSFASFELPRFTGPNTQARFEFLKQNLWITPFAVFVGIIGIIQAIARLLKDPFIKIAALSNQP